jgi:hypothetical protein
MSDDNHIYDDNNNNNNNSDDQNDYGAFFNRMNELRLMLNNA